MALLRRCHDRTDACTALQAYTQKLATCLLEEPEANQNPGPLHTWTAQVTGLVRTPTSARGVLQMGIQACRQHTCAMCWSRDGCCCLASACSHVAVSSICIDGPQADLVCLCLLAVVLKLPSCLQVTSSSICGHGAVLPCKQHSCRCSCRVNHMADTCMGKRAVLYR